MTVRAKWMGDTVKGAVRRGAVRGLLEGAEVAKAASVEQVPRETDRLMNSAYTDVDESTLISIVGYDDPRDIKTIKQHEDLTYNHPRGGNAKFLENPVKASGNAAYAKLAAQLRQVLQ